MVMGDKSTGEAAYAERMHVFRRIRMRRVHKADKARHPVGGNALITDKWDVLLRRKGFRVGIVLFCLLAAVKGGTHAFAGTDSIGGLPAAGSSPAAEASPGIWDKQIGDWITLLSGQPSFKEWKEATWQKWPLGPGMHGWVVLVYSKKEHKELGYLIVGAKPDGGVKLVEYGTGGYPLFSLNLLDKTLREQGYPAMETTAERVFIGSFEAVWRIDHRGEVVYADAKTGERYPLTDEDVNRAIKSGKDPAALAIGKATSSCTVPPFDPYDRMNFIDRPPIKLDSFEPLGVALRRSIRVTYTSSVFDRTIVLPAAVTGFQVWDGNQIAVALDMEGTRFFPFAALQACGQFFK